MKKIINKKIQKTIVVKDFNDNRFRVSINDPRYLSGELIQNTKQPIPVKFEGNIFYCKANDPNVLNGTYIKCTKKKKYYNTKTNEIEWLFPEDEIKKEDTIKYIVQEI